jgi:hypothetical protein
MSLRHRDERAGSTGIKKTVGTTTQDQVRLLRWAVGLGKHWLWAAEDWRHMTRRLKRDWLAAWAAAARFEHIHRKHKSGSVLSTVRLRNVVLQLITESGARAGAGPPHTGLLADDAGSPGRNTDIERPTSLSGIKA